VVLADCPFDRALAGKNLAEVTAMRGRQTTIENAAETMLDLQRQGGCAAIYHALDERDVERILGYPFTMIASDGEIPLHGEGVPHPRSYGTFARVLGRYVRERKLLTLEGAVRKMTSLPAWRLGLRDRGLLKAGMKADLVVFDAAAIADRATFLNPRQHAAGVRHVFVNGKPVVLDGRITGQRPGRVLLHRNQ
jgi:dihydroorotase/N-acyl-D-amino-acid deacylase